MVESQFRETKYNSRKAVTNQFCKNGKGERMETGGFLELRSRHVSALDKSVPR